MRLSLHSLTLVVAAACLVSVLSSNVAPCMAQHLPTVRSASRAPSTAAATFTPLAIAPLLQQAAPEPPPDPYTLRIEHMQHALTQSARHSRVFNLRVQGVFLMAFGALAAGFGTYLAIDGGGMGQTLTRGIVSASPIMFGVSYAVTGVRLIVADETFAEGALRRFTSLRDAGRLTPLEIARFEGELNTRAWTGRDRRITNGYAYLGSAIAGLGLLAIALSGELQDDALGYAASIGGVYALLGTWQAVVSFSGESDEEKRWRQYVQSVQADQQPWLR